MPHTLSRLLPVVLLVLSLMSCGRTPRGVMSINEMADLIADLHIAEAYLDQHAAEFPDDSSKLILKQSVFKKHGITSQDYDSSMVWYAHNMEDYIKAHDRALRKLQERYDHLAKNVDKSQFKESKTIGDAPATAGINKHRPMRVGATGDTADLWQGKRSYMLTQGARRGFIPFDFVPDAEKRPGDRYQLSYKLTRGSNDFKVSLNVDYSDGATAQVSRATNNDGWVTIDLQSDTARQVRRVYGYVSYNIQRQGVAYVDSLMLVRTHLNKSNYSFIHAQRLLERSKKQ